MLRKTAATIVLAWTVCAVVPEVGAAAEGVPQATRSTPMGTPKSSLEGSAESALSVIIDKIRLEPAPHRESDPFTTLKFDLVNSGNHYVTSLRLQISIAETREHIRPDEAVIVLVRPFIVHNDVVLNPGYSMNYEMLLRGLSAADCHCVASVNVVSVRSLLK